MTLNDLTINTVLFNEDIQIAQCNNHFKYSIDSLILSRFVNISKSKSILEIGTNNAVIPALLAKRTDAEITAIEINKEAIPYAKKTLELNGIESRVNVIEMDYIKYSLQIRPKKYDTIICNPPYFENDKSRLVKTNNNLANARHDNTLSISDLIKYSRPIIENNGTLTIVLRPDRLTEVKKLLVDNGFEPKRLMFCYPKKGKNSNLFIIEAKFQGNPGLVVEHPLTLHNDDGSYSNDLKEYIGDINEAK